MKYITPIFLVLVLWSLTSALLQAASNDPTEPDPEIEYASDDVPVQFTQTGKKYRHGHWCMDQRVF